MKVKEILGNNSTWMPGSGYDTNEPLVSVLLPTFRRAKSGYFEKAVDSVLNQSLKNIELIIIDDCSTDGTFDLIKYYMKLDGRVSCIRHNYNVGLPAISEYEGYMRAKSDYIAFIFDDNEWDPNYLHKSLLYMNKHNILACYGLVHSYFGHGINDYIVLGNCNNGIGSTDDLIVNNFIANGGVILHKEVINEVGLYDPHLSLTRLCDWDLWRRIIRVFKFDGTNIYAGVEHGAKLKDSLGNTVAMNSWVSLEQICRDRNDSLKPNVFEEYEVDKIYNNSSQLFAESIDEFYANYSEKKWYKDRGNINHISDADNCMKRVLILMDYVVDATITLSFQRLLYNTNNLIIRFGLGVESNLALSDAVIVIRNIQKYKPQIEKCLQYQIPCYYYVDDNYIALSKDYQEDKVIKETAEYLTIEKLAIFKGLLVSSNKLKDFFIDESIHNNVILLEPIYEELFKPNRIKDSSNTINIGFMGGKFRMEVFKKVVLPAILKVSEHYNINLYYPGDEEENEGINVLSNKRISIQSISRSSSLNTTLRNYNDKDIDILIHCGPSIINNIYKTENSLLNATALGAVLVASNNPPYKNGSGKIYFTAENNINSWYEVIMILAQNKELRTKTIKKAKEYCVERYSGNKISAVLVNELSKYRNCTSVMSIQRYESLYLDLLNTSINGNNRIIRMSRSLIDVPICLSKLVKKSVSYKIKCDVDNLSQIGFTLSSYGKCEGTLNIQVLYKNKCIRTAILQLDKIKKDFWNYVDFDPIRDSLNKVYKIKLTFHYTPNSAQVGVFEDMTKRSIIYKLANKCGIHLLGMNTIFVDCRSEEDKI